MPSPDSPQNEATRQALLTAATTVFARDGYQIARVRDIAAEAGANVSAVNYHFGNKLGLYEAVITQLAQDVIDRHPLLPPETDALPIEERLRLLVQHMLERFIVSDSSSMMVRFMVREMANPTPALDRLVAEVSKPQFAVVSGVIRELLGSAATEQRVRDCTLSLFGQAMFYVFCRPLVTRLFPKSYSKAHLDELVQHIAGYSLSGIKHYQESAASD